MKSATQTAITALLLCAVPSFADIDADRNPLPANDGFVSAFYGTSYVSGRAGIMGGSFKPESFSALKLDTMGSLGAAIGYHPAPNLRLEVEFAGAAGDVKEKTNGMNELETILDVYLLENFGTFSKDIKGEASVLSVSAQAYYLVEVSPNLNLTLNGGIGAMKGELEFNYDVLRATRYSGGVLYGNYLYNTSEKYSATFLFASVGCGVEWKIDDNISIGASARYFLSQEKDMDGVKAKPDLYNINVGITFFF